MTLVQRVALACVALASNMAWSSAFAAPLTVALVAAPGVNCNFQTSCSIVVTDSTADLPPVPGYTGRAFLQSRTSKAATSGVPGAGTTVYMYRVDLTAAKAATDQMCVSSVAIDFGPITRLSYNGAGIPAVDVFVVTSGGMGSIGLQSAEQVGSTVTFHFSTSSFPSPGEKFPPVCAGQTSFFFGLASTKAPVATTAKVHMGVYGTRNVGARAPAP